MAHAVWLLGLAGVVASGVAAILLVGTLLDTLAGAKRSSTTRRRIADSSFARPFPPLSVTGGSADGDSSLLARNFVGRRVAGLIIEAGVSSRPGRAVSRFLVVDALVFVAAWVGLRNPWPAMVLSIGALVFGYFWLQNAAEHRLEKMRSQLPDAFTLVGNSLASGLSLVQALAYASAETPEPLGPQLLGLVNEVAAGVSLSESLHRFSASVPLRELQVISAAIEIQHRVGGNIREMLEQATQSVRQSLELRMSLRAQTAQGRLSSKVVGLMPLALVTVMGLVMDGYLESFFGTQAGVLMFCTAIAAEVAGFVIIRNVLDIEI